MRREFDQAALKRILDFCAELEATGEAIGFDPSPASRRRQRARRKEILRQLRLQLSSPSPRALPGWLRSLRRRHRLDPGEMLLLALLLHRRVGSAEPFVLGRDLLRPIAESSGELLAQAAVLHRDARLLRGGLVVNRTPAGDSALDAEYRIAERLFREACRSFQPAKRRRRVSKATPWVSSVEQLFAFRDLVHLHQRRAALLFPGSFWADTHPDAREQAEDLDAAIAAARHAIDARERATGKAVLLPIRGLREEYGLTPDEEIILLTLLFQELFGAGPVMAAELVRVVSETSEHLLHQRTLLSTGAPLLASGLVTLDGDLDDKPLLAEAYLPQWVVERLLAGGTAVAGIAKEEQTRFHAFLRGLDGSDDFYRHL